MNKMNEQELIELCLVGEDAILTYPFKDDKYDEIPILRHKSNNKWFGVIFYLENVLYINLKAKPETISILKEQYPDIITSAWHMNKTHWCKVDVNKIEVNTLKAIIQLSFDITAPKRKMLRYIQ